ncbi:L-ascorbate 6-phosphate lactonase [Propionibacterium cyclohexanicum]|uniref:L-ascorbate 6-phosphate lactonase n=1 Tax=Propionibacterium cyclohexanicum TaxID=64702 RepID=A0A1H9QR47_9ACTN|nr:L-ascorbate 6-phosphate lactonase [Propionibacterium cyclohexanicum]SER62922.1 L-ascorbate 6-phosphate lactonase [Propionibacterium cyclohexanicum]
MSDDDIFAVSEDSWRREVFPEWGSWLNEEIESSRVAPGHLAMWWIGNMGIWLKTSAGTGVAVDLWCGTGKRSHLTPENPPRHQWRRQLGSKAPQPNLRTQPMTLNPFAIHDLDALLVTHFHHDHLDRHVAAAIVQNVASPIPFVGPQSVANQWLAWGVPRDRIVVVHPGDSLTIGDVTVDVLESFDRTALITDPVGMELPDDDHLPAMAERAVSYLLRTPAGSVYHAGDSHYSVRFAEQGDRFPIDIALLAYGENPVGVQDKMTSSDILRAAEALGTKVVIPLHWDAWTTMRADPAEVSYLWRLRRDRFDYRFHPFSWLPGGHFDWPADRARIEYLYPRGFTDRFSEPTNTPYPEMF